MDFIMQPWPWWFSGILIGLTVPLLYFLTGQGFGISTSFQQIGAWTLMFVVGIAAGGFIANHFLSAEPVEFLPASYMGVGGAIRLLIGGILVGFGTRYAGGCTSGHAITGISNLNWPSLVGNCDRSRNKQAISTR